MIPCILATFASRVRDRWLCWSWSYVGATGGMGPQELSSSPCSSGCHYRPYLQLLSCQHSCLDSLKSRGLGPASALFWPFISHTSPATIPRKTGLKHVCFGMSFCCLKCTSAILVLEGDCGQRFTTAPAQSCTALPLHEHSRWPCSCQRHAGRMQCPDVAHCNASLSLLLPEMGPTFLSDFLAFPSAKSLLLLPHATYNYLLSNFL